MPEPCIVHRALEFALVAHSGQRRKDSRAPYFVHPVEVMKRLTDLGVEDEALLSAAVLHDVVEDTAASLRDIEQAFGPIVASLVDELTFSPEREDKASYLHAFAHRSAAALAIKLLDRACNVDDYARARPDYASTYARKAMAVYDAVHARCDELGAALGPRAARLLWSEADRLRSLAMAADADDGTAPDPSPPL